MVLPAGARRSPAAAVRVSLHRPWVPPRVRLQGRVRSGPQGTLARLFQWRFPDDRDLGPPTSHGESRGPAAYSLASPPQATLGPAQSVWQQHSGATGLQEELDLCPAAIARTDECGHTRIAPRQCWERAGGWRRLNRGRQ